MHMYCVSARPSNCLDYLENTESSSKRLESCLVSDHGNVLVKPYSLASDAALHCLLRLASTVIH